MGKRINAAGNLCGVHLMSVMATGSFLVPHQCCRPTEDETGCSTLAAFLVLRLGWDRYTDRTIFLYFVNLAFLFVGWSIPTEKEWHTLGT